MKKSSILLIAGIAILVIWEIFAYNGMVSAEEACEKAWGDVEAQYQRREDLIDNLVSTVKGYASHEQKTLTDVVEARSKASQTKVTIENLDDESLEKFQQAQGELSSAFSRLLAVSEAYPDLKANENFHDLQVSIEGTENRIGVHRMRFNETAQAYNKTIRRFPNVLVASILRFKKKPYFKAQEGAEKAPKVQF